MTGYRYFMKSVTINLLSLIVVFVFYAYQNVLLANGGGCPPFYQESYGVKMSNGEEFTLGDFFNPKISVCGAWAQCNDCEEFQAGDCRYIWPSNYVTYEDTDDKGWPMLCGCPTFSCSLPWDPANWSKSCMADSKKKCFKIPRAPSPPPFCPSIGSGTNVSARFVIVSPADIRNKIFNSILQVEIKDDLYPPKTHNVKINRLTVKKEQTFDIYSDSRQYKLKAKITNPLLVEAQLYNENYLITTASIPLPKITIPKMYTENNNNSQVSLDFCSSNQAKDLKEKLCSSNTTINTLKPDEKFYVPRAQDDSGFYIMKARMNVDKHELFQVGGQYASYIEDDRSKLICLAELPSTPKKYLFKETIDNGQGKKYTKYNWLSDYGVGFQRNAVMIHTTKTGLNIKHYIPCENFEPKLIEDMPQSQLNGIKIQGGYYVFPEDEKNNKTDVNDDPCNQNNKVVYSYGKISKMIDYDPNKQCNTLTVSYSDTKQKLFCITSYKDEDTGDDFWKKVFETNPNNQKSQYIDGFITLDSYNNGTCINTSFISDVFYTVTPYDKMKGESNQEGTKQKLVTYNVYEDVKNPDYDPNCNSQTSQNPCPSQTIKRIKNNCDYFKVEAWGGGGAGYISNNNNYTMGSSGDYVRATFNPSKYPKYTYIGMIVGRGAKANTDPMQDNEGGNTEVKLCHDITCHDFITANGGGQQPKLDYEGAFYITAKNATAIPMDEIFYPRFSSGSSIIGENNQKIAVPYINEYLSKGIYSTSQCDTRKKCYNKITSNKDICLKTNDNNNKNDAVLLFGNNVFYKWSNSEKKIDEYDTLSGSGGCINRMENILQDGASGKVKITCEKFFDN